MVSNPDNQKAVQTVSPRQWIGIVVVYLSIPLVLLVCGGDFGWWQAWVYSMLIVAAGIGGRIWAERRHPGLLAERQNIEKIHLKFRLYVQFMLRPQNLTWHRRGTHHGNRVTSTRG